MKLSNNYSLSEFLVSRFFNEDQQQKVLEEFEINKDVLLPNVTRLATNLQVLRDYLGVAISINISYRPIWYEILMGRAGTSKHTLGLAADIKVKGFTTKQIREAIEYLISTGEMEQGGLGKYATFTHYDVRGNKARW
jgi:uncharacterized protein YcbK (DUF882 family)